MERIVLEELIQQGLSQREIGEKTGLGQTSIRYWLKKYQLSTVNVKDSSLACRYCGETDPDKFYNFKDGYRRKRCKRCDNERSTERFRNYKQLAVDYKGGKCSLCGYDKCIGSLDFHHRDAATKDPRWELMRNWSFARIKDELDKCDCLCRNCHGELHWNEKNAAVA